MRYIENIFSSDFPSERYRISVYFSILDILLKLSPSLISVTHWALWIRLLLFLLLLRRVLYMPRVLASYCCCSHGGQKPRISFHWAKFEGWAGLVLSRGSGNESILWFFHVLEAASIPWPLWLQSFHSLLSLSCSFLSTGKSPSASLLQGHW